MFTKKIALYIEICGMLSRCMCIVLSSEMRKDMRTVIGSALVTCLISERVIGCRREC